MSRLRGRVDWWPSDADPWLRRLADVLPGIHGAPLPPAGLIGSFAPDPQASYQPPPWARYPRAWERAAEISHGPSPEVPTVLMHRDFHPGNVLWRRGNVSGVVSTRTRTPRCGTPSPGPPLHHRPVVAHRLSTVTMADRIIVMDAGQVQAARTRASR
jgi:hypothetical protein